MVWGCLCWFVWALVRMCLLDLGLDDCFGLLVLLVFVRWKFWWLLWFTVGYAGCLFGWFVFSAWSVLWALWFVCYLVFGCFGIAWWLGFDCLCLLFWWLIVLVFVLFVLLICLFIMWFINGLVWGCFVICFVVYVVVCLLIVVCCLLLAGGCFDCLLSWLCCNSILEFVFVMCYY